MDAASSPPLRIVLCPHHGFGHLLPFLELAERLASRGHHVSYVSTPRNLARLPPRRHADAIDLVALPFPRVEGLPDGAESTSQVPYDKSAPLWKAFDGLAAPFAEFLGSACAGEGTRPDWVVADTFHHWAATVALEHKVPCAMLLPSAAMIASLWAPRSPESTTTRLFEEPEERPKGVTRFEWDMKVHFFGNHASGMSTAQRCALTLQRCTITAMRSCPEWELEAYPQAAAVLGKPLVPLGLLTPSPDGGRCRSTGAGTDDGGEEAAAVIRWLDAQPPSSVVYVALGSEVPLPVPQVHELALGLARAGTRFLWALRKPSGVPDDNVLPPDFQERTRDHGVVAMGWVPQMAVLAHGAVGSFLTHCGRNSLIEGLMFGHPLIMLPIIGDQWPNARAMEGRKVGRLVARDEDDASFDSEGIATAVRAVMLDEEARKVFVANALKMQAIAADQELHERYIDEFIRQLRSYVHN